jgi:hypothetical protein
MKCVTLIAALLCVVITSGCVSLDIGTDRLRAPEISTLASAYVGLGGFEDHDQDSFIRIGLLHMDERPGEIFSIDVRSLAGFGIGLVGARAHLLPLDAGIGALWYQPAPTRIQDEDDDDEIEEDVD